MSNSLLTPTIIAKEGLMQLRNNMVMGGLVHREYVNEFKKIGQSVQIRRPNKFVAKDGATRQAQDVTEGYITLTISKRKHVSWEFTTQDLTLTIDQYSERYVTPASLELGNIVDVDLLALYSSFGHSVGTPGTTPQSFDVMGDMATKMDRAAVPQDGKRRLVLEPGATWKMAGALKGSFDPSLARDTVRRGMLGRLANLEIYGDQNVAMHTTGSAIESVGVQVDGAISDSYSSSVNYSTITLDGFDTTAQTVKAGDVFTIAGTYAINPRSRQSTGVLQDFVVLSDVTLSTSDGAGGYQADFNVWPRIIASGAYQTVSASAADDSAVTFRGSASTSYPQNLGFHRNAMGLVMVPLELPRSANFKARSTMEGVSIRVIEDYDIDNDEEIVRMDILYGVKALYEDLAVRMWG